MSEAPERIWACMDGPMVGLFVSGGYDAGWPEYVRADLFDAVKAERDNYKALYEAERDDELLNIARQAGYQDGVEDRRKLEARVKALTAALEFYADRGFDGYNVGIGDYGLSIEAGEIIKDGGDRARAALQENTDDR